MTLSVIVFFKNENLVTMDIFATVEKKHSMKLGIIGREEQAAPPTELHAGPSFPAQGQRSPARWGRQGRR